MSKRTKQPQKRPVDILCGWAFAKVNLKKSQSESPLNPEKVNSAISEFRIANRAKKDLDLAYAFHHDLLVEFLNSDQNTHS